MSNVIKFPDILDNDLVPCGTSVADDLFFDVVAKKDFAAIAKDHGARLADLVDDNSLQDNTIILAGFIFGLLDLVGPTIQQMKVRELTPEEVAAYKKTMLENAPAGGVQ